MLRQIRKFTSTNTLLKQITIYKIKPITKKLIETPIPFTKTFQKKVIFNLLKLSRLSGSEKIDLLRDYIIHKQTAEALFVYKKIIENGFSNRLKYNDHHTLFHLCIQDPLKFEKEIKMVDAVMAENGYETTENYVNQFLICASKWGNVEYCLGLLRQYRKEYVITIDTWDSIFTLLLQKELPEEGLKLYKDMKSTIPITRESRKTYTLVMSFYAKLKDMNGMKHVYYDAEENLSRLFLVHQARSSCPDGVEEQWKATQFVTYTCQLLDTLVSMQQYDLVQEIYVEMIPILPKAKNGINIYHILFKMLEKQKSGLVGVYWDAMTSAGIKPDYLSYSRKCMLVDTIDELEEVYRLAITTLSLNAFKRMAIDSSFVRGYFRIAPENGLDVFEKMRKNGLLKIVYLELIDLLRSRGALEDADRVSLLLKELVDKVTFDSEKESEKQSPESESKQPEPESKQRVTNSQ